MAGMAYITLKPTVLGFFYSIFDYILGRTAAADTALRKPQSVMRDNVNANFGSRLRLLEKLEKAGYSLLLPKLAGQDLQPIAPKGIARVAAGTNVLSQATELANPQTLALLPLTSPRLMGEGALAAGRVCGC